MKKGMFTLFCLYSVVLSLRGQEDNVTNQGRIDLSLSGLSIAYELPVSRKVAFEAAVGLGAGYDVSDGGYSYHYYLDDPSAFATLGVKYLYNRPKRVEKGKSLDYNSGNYWGVKAKYATTTIINDFNYETMLFGIHWGVQRRLSNHISYGFNLGIGYGFDLSEYKGVGSLFPDCNIRISYHIPFIK